MVFTPARRLSTTWPLLLTALLAGCGEKQTQHALSLISGPTMGTEYTVKITDIPDHIVVTQLKVELEDLLLQVNRQMSTYDPDSELSQINQLRETGPIAVSDELYTVLQKAAEVYQLSDGAFDVTVGPLVNLWGFGPNHQEDNIPADSDIRDALLKTGMDKIELKDGPPPTLYKSNPEAYLDLSGIAKGYGVDHLANHLESNGIENYMVEIGGEIRTRGVNEKNLPWHIAIEKPAPDERRVFNIITPGYMGLASSGDYRNYFERDGKRYSHTINPRTGRPIDHTLASVTVLMPDSMSADALATALMVMGPEEGYALAKERNIPALFIVKKGAGFISLMTPEFEPFLAKH
jgi:thiamine biosynthesis lipoprotein